MYYRIENFIQKYMDGDTITQLMLIAFPAWFTIVLNLNVATFEQSRSYYFMNLLADTLNPDHALMNNEQLWVIFSGAIVAVSGMLWQNGGRLQLVLCNLSLSFWHIMVATCIFMGSPTGTGGGTYFILAVGAFTRSLWIGSGRRHGQTR